MIDFRVIRRCASLVAAVTLLSAGAAHAQTGGAELVPARISYGFLRFADHTRFDQLVVWNASPGATATFNDSSRTLTFSRPVSRAGVVDFTPLIRRIRFRDGQSVSVTIAHPARDADGTALAYPEARKQVLLRVGGRGAAQTRRCWVRESPEQDAAVECLAPCPPPPGWEALGYCQANALLVPLPRFSAVVRPAPGGGVRITRLRVAGLPLPPPFSDATVAIFCNGRGCPFGARIYAGAAARRPLDVRALRGRTLRPGAVIEIHVVKGSYFGRVQRYVVRRRGLSAHRLCLWPFRLEPTRCPRFRVPEPLLDPPPPLTG